LQDNEGYIWIATPSGLVRFDGEHFITYGASYKLSETSVRALFLDKDEHLWVGFENGKVYVQNEKTFELIINDSINPKGDVSDISQNNKGDILVSTTGSGVFLIRNTNSATSREIYNYTGKEGVWQMVFKPSIPTLLVTAIQQMEIKRSIPTLVVTAIRQSVILPLLQATTIIPQVLLEQELLTYMGFFQKRLTLTIIFK
jgi:hypothetical protein